MAFVASLRPHLYYRYRRLFTNTGHCMYVRSKLHHISYDDAIQFAKDSGIRRADAIIREVADSLRNSVKLPSGMRFKTDGSVPLSQR